MHLKCLQRVGGTCGAEPAARRDQRADQPPVAADKCQKQPFHFTTVPRRNFRPTQENVPNPDAGGRRRAGLDGMLGESTDSIFSGSSISGHFVQSPCLSESALKLRDPEENCLMPPKNLSFSSAAGPRWNFRRPLLSVRRAACSASEGQDNSRRHHWERRGFPVVPRISGAAVSSF